MRKTTLPIIAFIFLMAINHSLQSQPITIKSFTQNFEKKEGFLNYYWDNNKGRVYLEVKNLNQEMIYVNYLSAGVGSNDIGLDRGQIGGTRIIKFIKMGPKILMVQPNYKYRAV